MKNKYTALDQIIAKEVFGVYDFERNNKGIKALPMNSKANEPLWAMDMVYDYRLKKFSSHIDESLILLDKIIEKKFRYELGQKFDNSFYISLWSSDYERQL